MKSLKSFDKLGRELTHKDICPYYESNCESVGCVCPKYKAYEAANDPKMVEEEIARMGIDPNKDPLTIMMEMQKLFAAKFHKVDGFTKDEVDKWMLAYDGCITDEITEVHEHLSVFPGIDAKENKLELQKEFIDIWHFLMDQFIVAGMDANKLVEVYVQECIAGATMSYALKTYSADGDPLDMIFNREYNLLNSKLNGELSVLSKDDRDMQILIYSNLILAGMRKVRQQISWKHWKKPADKINYNQLHSALAYSFKTLVQCFILSGLDAKELTKIYTQKNIENVFRQKFGY
ncbi:dUTPase [compost metagenome]